MLNSFFLLALSSVHLLNVDCKDPPEAPTKYWTNIEANIANQHKTYLLEEWYDSSVQRARRTFHWSSFVFTFLEDYSSETDALWIYLQSANDLENVLFCDIDSYSNRSHSSNYYRFISFFGQWLTSGSGSMTNATYEGIVGDISDDGQACGDYNMRGLLANKWVKPHTYDYTDSTSGAHTFLDFNVSYFWSLSNWTYAQRSNANNTEIPLRIEVNGIHNTTRTNGSTDIYDFYHSYEYTSFFSGDDAFDTDEYLDFFTEMPDWVDDCDTTNYCKYYPDSTICSDSQGPSFPEFSDEFEVIMEVNDKINNITFMIGEFYDYPNDRARISFYYDSDFLTDSYHQLELDSKEQQWFWIGDEYGNEMTYCTMNYVENNYTGIDIFADEVNGHISRPSKWFHFENNKTWLGYTTVREGIFAEKWKSTWDEQYPCCNNSYYIDINASSYFYFTTKDWNMSFSNWNGVSPLRLELNGFYDIYNITSDGSKVFWFREMLDASYEMIGFVSGMTSDSYFALPTNWREKCSISESYCNNNQYSDELVCKDEPTLPTLPNTFETTVECVFSSKNFSMVVDEFYDYPNNRERIIMYPYTFKSSVFGWSADITYSTHYLEDGDIFWSWTQTNGDSVDSEYSSVENCELNLVSDTQSEGISTWFDSNSNHISTTKTLFDWVTNNSVETYIGTQTIRGIECNQWKHNVQNLETTFEYYGTTYYYTSNFTVIYSFMTDEFKSTEIYGEYGVPVRAEVSGYTMINSDNGFETTHNFDHYYNYIKFLPITPDEDWFEPPENVLCNITKYCNDIVWAMDDSASVEGESSEDFYEWCEDISDNGLYTLESDSEDDNGSSNKNDSSSGNNVGLWILAFVLMILGVVVGYRIGVYREQKKQPMIRLEDDPNQNI